MRTTTRRATPTGRRPAARRRTVRRPLGALLIAATLAAAGTGCGTEQAGPGDGGGDGGRGDTAFGRALTVVPASYAGESITFRDVDRIRPLLSSHNRMYRGLADYGIPELGRYAAVDTGKDMGVDLKKVATSLTVGQTPTTVLSGTFDPDAVSSALTRRGYHARTDDTGTRLTKTGSPSVDVSRTLRVERSSPSSPTVPLTPPRRSVRDDAAYRAVSDCLGDTYEATLYGKHAGKNKDVVLLGIGGRLTAGGGSSETLCAVTTSKDAANATAQTLRDRETAPGKRYAGAEVTVTGGDTPVVTMTWQNKDAPGLRPADSERSLELPSLVLKLFGSHG